MPTTEPEKNANDKCGCSTNIQSLSRDYYNQAGQLVWHDDYFGFAGLTYHDNGKPRFALGTAGVHFLRTEYAYDDRGRLSRFKTPNGAITRTVYDGQGRVVSTWRGSDDVPVSGYWSPTNPAGMAQDTALEYDGGGVGAGNLTRSTLKPGGGAADRVTASYYDWRNRLVAVKYGVESVESVSINRPVTYFDFDNLDRVVKTRLYDGDGLTMADADSDGVPDAPSASLLRRQTETLYDAEGRAYRFTERGTNPVTGALTATPAVTDTWFDRRGNAVKVRRPGGLTEKRVLDGLGRVTLSSLTNAGGDANWADAKTVAGDVVWSETASTFDIDGDLIQVTRKSRAQGQAGTGALGTPVSGVRARVIYAGLYHDAAGRPVASVDVGTAGVTAMDPGGSSAWVRPAAVPARSDAVLVTSTAYDAAGRAFEVTSPGGRVTRTAYDLLGRVTGATTAFGTADAYATSYAYNDKGQLLTATSPGGRVTRSGYDALGRLTTVTWADGTAVSQTASTAYDLLDNVVAVATPAGTTVAPASSVTRTAYDALGGVASVTAGDGSSVALTTAFGSDALGRIVSVTEPGNFVTSTAYDDALRKVTVTDPAGGKVTSQFDLAGNRVGVTDALGRFSNTAYDLLNRPTLFTDAGGAKTGYEYLATSDRDAATDARGNRTATVYDRLGRAAVSVDPFGLATTTLFNRDGESTSVTDRLGRERRFTRDNLGRVSSESWYAAGTGSLVQAQAFGFDAAGNLKSATDPDGDYAITSDQLNRVVTVAGPHGVTLSFGYDRAGNRATASDNKGASQASGYDLLGRLTSRSLAAAGKAARVDLAYDARGQRSTLTRSSNAAGTSQVGSTAYGYDSAGRVTSLTHKSGTGVSLFADSYAYDLAGQLKSRTQSGVTEALGHDSRGQVTASASGSYSYDLTGNRTTAGVVTSAMGNRLLSDGVWTYAYDAEGQLASKTKGAGLETWTYGTDHRDQVVWAEKRSSDGGPLEARVEYAYDALGNRVRRVEKSGTLAVVSDEKFVFDCWDTAKPGGAVGTENFDTWADLTSAGGVVAWRLFGPGYDEALARLTAAGGASWYLEPVMYFARPRGRACGS